MPLPRRKLSFSSDALYDMAHRQISEADVQNALANQLIERPGTNVLQPTIVIEGTAMDGGVLCVVVAETNPNRIVSLFRPKD